MNIIVSLLVNSFVEHPADEQEEAVREIWLREDLGIKFTHNLNPTLRDEYKSNGENTRTGEKKSSPVRVQGYKKDLPENQKRASVPPKIHVSLIKHTKSGKYISCFQDS